VPQAALNGVSTHSRSTGSWGKPRVDGTTTDRVGALCRSLDEQATVNGDKH